MMNYFAAEDAQKETEEEVFNTEVFIEWPITEQELQEAILNSFPPTNSANQESA